MAKKPKHPLTNQSTLTIIMCAFACEAKPLIDFFKLKKEKSNFAFSIYKSGSVILFVSGMGKEKMSAAVNAANEYLPDNKTHFWLNVGIAGHQTAEIGQLFCAQKISDERQSFFSTSHIKHTINSVPLITVNLEETQYKKNALYDMEGSAFYQTAIRFNNPEYIQCLKVVSDNKQYPARKDKIFISNLIANQCENIVVFISLHTQALESLN